MKLTLEKFIYIISNKFIELNFIKNYFLKTY